MASAKALLEWSRVACAGYPCVEVKDLSASFRDGLAFCAIIHRHRPDLIDFSSLSRENVYQNNKLAFGVAEVKLGISPLLDPKDMVTTSVPDFLSVITYISQYYNVFSGKSDVSSRSRSSHVLNITRVQKTLKSQKSVTELETSKEASYANTRTKAMCNICFKPIHLIQRHLIDGKVYHRSCFRCKVCGCVLLPGSFTQGSDKLSFICTHHATDRKAGVVDNKQQFRSADNPPQRPFQTGFYSLSGSVICNVPRYTQRTESQDRMVSKMQQTEETERQQGNKWVDSEGQKTASKKVSELSLSSTQVTEGSAYPVPAPRRSVDFTVVPVPAPRTRTTQTMSCSTAAETRSKSSPRPSGIGSPKVKTNHPWMAIVHPGPWTQLPPAEPPIPFPRSKSVSNTQTPWNMPRRSPVNPFEEDEDVDEAQLEAPKHDPASPSGTCAAADHPDNNEITQDKVASHNRETPASGSETNTDDGRGDLCTRRHFKEEHEGADADSKILISNLEGNKEEPADCGSSDVRETVAEQGFSSAQSSVLPRSLSVPAISSEPSEANSVLAALLEANLSVSSRESKSACGQNPFSHQSEMSRSHTVQNLSSARGPAPGHGFPLIRRQVRTDQEVSTEDLQKQMRNLDGHLEALEQRGVELERNIRDGKRGKQEQMLTEWLALIHEQHNLLRKNKQLVYLTAQQILEDRQADVEYDLRCLLNKPEREWSQEDRSQEEQLMAELLTIIDRRNQIVSSLYQDRETDEDIESTKNKGFQKDELKMSKGKLKVLKIFKKLNH